ncbi:MAG: malto-oligosyltrehalose synthase [Candidatus Methanospirareceae archaeon]
MRIPVATYRIQFNPSFDFQAARGIIPYLAELGISDIYASPIFKARKGSTHGYDVVDPNQLNPELGEEQDFEELIRELKNYGMGWIQDIVPNHVAYDYENWMLMDVLENGESSEYLRFFDIDWDHPCESIRGKLLAPFLGRFYGKSLEDREIQLKYGAAGLSVNYYHLALPLKIESYIDLFAHQLSALKRKLGGDHPDFIKLLGILYVLKTLPTGEERDERYDQITFIKRTLWELYTGNPEMKRCIDANVQALNGEKGNPESFNLLDNLLSEQLFKLSFWKVATEEINYRRFFSINELICLRAEDKDVFDHTHALIFQLIAEGKVSGLRIDHIDGLYDPTNYLKRLQERTGGVYTIVEKILGTEEELPPFWATQGTTGYEFLNYLNGIFCKKNSEKQFNRVYSDFTGFKMAYDNLVCEKKRLIIGKHMAGDVDNLAHLMKGIAARYRHGSDITLYGIKRTIVELMTQFSVYRTYINNEVSRKNDHLYIKEAVKRSIERAPDLLNELDFIERFLLLKFEDYLAREEKEQWIHFVMRFQQFTGPLMAKGFEDTVLYIYNRLLSLNEVGGSPDRFGTSLKEFHSLNRKRGDLHPHSLNATSTHDTKRGEDVRARINVLSEIPDEWEHNLKQWNKINRGKKRTVNGRTVPDGNDEYFLYQTLIGAFPFYESEYPAFIERVKDYIIKAVREAKVRTAWLNPDTEYEDAYISYVEEILREENQFLEEFMPFQKKVSHYGMFNSLSQTLIKITSPGVPDFYQGTELWDLNLVDPDNRRAVDFEERISLLGNIMDRSYKELLATREDGGIKLFLINRALQARKERADVFQKGCYISIEAGGRFKEHIVAFARKHGDDWTITIAQRHLTTLIEEGELPIGRQVWGDTHIILPKGVPALWKDAITTRGIEGRETLLMCEALEEFPVALLMSEKEGG